MRDRLLCGLSAAAGALGAAAVLLSPCCAFAGPGELQGAFSSTQWATIGDAGNRRPTDAEVGRAPPAHRPHPGSVGYEYRIATTEVTVGQHLEFLQAYSPFMPVGTVNAFSPTTGQWISLANFGVDEAPVFTSPSARHNWATTMSMRLAARMVNWLHNGQVNEAWAFESGVYDTSTFGEGPDGIGITDDYTRAPGARYWIPSIDEYYKAAFYDPNKPNDDGSLGGYWHYPNGSDSPSISGMPGDGGETNRGTGIPVDVGSYVHVLSPWGLLDVSGGEGETTDTISFPGSMQVYVFESNRHSLSVRDRLALWPGGVQFCDVWRCWTAAGAAGARPWRECSVLYCWIGGSEKESIMKCRLLDFTVFCVAAAAMLFYPTVVSAQSCGVAPIDIQILDGSYSCSSFETSLGSGVYNVVLTVKMADGILAIATVTPTASNVGIATLELRAEPPVPVVGLTTAGAALVEIEDGPSGTFARIESIIRVPQVDANKHDDVVIDVDISGSLGALGGGGEVVATRIDRLRCVGDITFDTITVVEPETSQVEYSEITLVESVNGSI